MECDIELQRQPSVSQSSRACEETTLAQEVQRMRVQERIKIENTRDPTFSGNDQKQWISKNATEDEVSKYTTKLPNYLERGNNIQEKVLNVRVLNWGRLEKWQCGNKQAPHRNSSYSPSSSNASLSYSTDRSTTESNRSYSCSPARQMASRVSLQFHLKACPKEDSSSTVRASRESESKSEEPKYSQRNALNQHEAFSTHMSYWRSHLNTKLDRGKSRELDPKSGLGCRTLGNLVKYEEFAGKKGNIEAKYGEEKKREEKHGKQNLDVLDRHAFRRPKEVPFPEDFSQIQVHRVCRLSDSRPVLDRRLGEASQRTIPGKCSNFQESRPFVTPTRSRPGEHPKELDLKSGRGTAEKARSSSPFRRLSISIGKLGKSSSSKEGLVIPQSNSTSKSAKFSSHGAVTSSSNDSCGDRPNTTGRARSSPLRRLLDPLLKPKADHFNCFPEPLQKGLMSKTGASKSSNQQVGSSTTQSMKAKLDTVKGETPSVNDFHKHDKQGSVAIQAIARVTIKNGLPLITFSINNDSEILVAKVKKGSSSGEGDCNWMYTFFAIREVKKTLGSWINQNGKGKGHNYISNIVAQMKVYDGGFSSLAGGNPPRKFSIREFVLFCMDPRLADRQASEFQPNDEAAAIVVRIPENIVQNSSGDGSLATRYCSTIGEYLHNQSFPISQDFFSATAILPSGIHSLPSRGIPSSLIDRWKSGGSCDCGGWDLGCKLRILSSQSHLTKKLTSSNQIELFSEEGGLENKPIFHLAPYKSGTFSIEFNSSLTCLQAFSICIAILDGRKLLGISEWSCLLEDKPLDATIMLPNDGARNPTQIEGEIPASFISSPPLSPVGRV